MAIDANTVGMSDAEFLAHMANQPSEVTVTSSNEAEVTNTVEDTQTTTTTEVGTETVPNVDEQVTESVTTNVTSNEPSQVTVNVDNNTQVETTEPVQATEIDYKAFYDTATQDYKANGITLPGVKDPEKLIAALQMATDYANKTAAIKPILKKAKLLEGISDEDFTEMLEFKKGNPEVIKKALKQYNIDPMLVDLGNIDYTPHSVLPSDDEVAFNSVVTNMQSAEPEIFKRVNESIALFDTQSQHKLVSGDGAYLKAFSEEIALGRFDKVFPLVQQHKVFNPKYSNVSDLDIYIDLAAEWDKLNPVTPVVTTPQHQPTQVANKPQAVVDPEIEAKKLAATIKTTTTNNNAKPTYDPTKLSDAEFMRLLAEGALFQTK